MSGQFASTELAAHSASTLARGGKGVDNGSKRVGRARQFVRAVSNLKCVDLSAGQVVALTGPSGAGKLSLAPDKLYVQGQRRFFESFSPMPASFANDCLSSLSSTFRMVSRPFQQLGYDAGSPGVKAVSVSVAVV